MKATDSEQVNLWQKIDQDLTQLDDFLEEKIPGQSPSFQLVRAYIRMKRSTTQLPQSEATNAEHASASVMSQSELPAVFVPAMNGAISSRDMAYDHLREIATFLARVEPHSPVPMVLRTLVTWRNAKFDDLLRRLPQEGGSVYELLRLFGSGSEQASTD